MLLFFAHLLKQKRNPAAVFAWFLVVLLAPYIGFLIYVIFDARKFRVTQKSLIVPSAKLSQISNPVQRTLVAGACPDPTTAEDIEFLLSGEKAFNSIVQAIRNAKKIIQLETYIFSRDEVALAILSELLTASSRGVRVQILLDALGAHLPGHPDFNELKKSGGEILLFMPLLHLPFRGQSNLRNHRKLLVIDGQIAIIGGMNIAAEYMGPMPDPKRWVDLAFKLTGKVVRDLQENFQRDWVIAGGGAEPSPQQVFAEGASHQPDTLHSVQVVPSGPDMSSDTIEDLLLTASYEARDRIWIATPYFVPGEPLAKAFELAARRGVDVRILIPKKSNHPVADVARRTFLTELSQAGCKIFYYPRMTHAKAVVIDETYVLIGSANMDGRSLLLNYELCACLYSAADIKKLSDWFEGVLNDASNEGPISRWSDPWTSALIRLLGPLL